MESQDSTEGVPCGQGVWFFLNGWIRIGWFKDGKDIGYGREIDYDLRMFEGEYDND